MAATRHIVGLGGAGDTDEQSARLLAYVLGLTGRERPRLLYVPTAVGDAADSRRGCSLGDGTGGWPSRGVGCRGGVRGVSSVVCVREGDRVWR